MPDQQTNGSAPTTRSSNSKQSQPLPPSTSQSRLRSSMAIGGVVYGWQEPHLTKTPWELERHKKRSRWRRSKVVENELPVAVFKILPKEVYQCIVVQLEQIHLRQTESCSSCYLRDLHSLSLVSRAWDKATTSRMYRNVLLVTSEEHAKSQKLKIRGTTRLNLLRRTLREQPTLARCVRELHLSDFQTLYQEAAIGKEEIVSLVASLVMACPRLERLVGFHVPFTHSFDRLSHALSTRSHLKEKVWLLSENGDDFSEEEDNNMGSYYLAACDPTERFLELNSTHPSLSTLVLAQHDHQDPVALNFRAIVGTCRAMPALRHLSISGLSATSFTNMTLNALPSQLESLRLERLPGINDKGLQRLATSQLAASVQKLMLIDLEVSSLKTVSNILSTEFAALQHFSLAQQKAPGLSSRASCSDFSSPTLRYVHFEFRVDAGPVPTLSPPSPDISEPPSFPFTNCESITCLATALLAEGIKKGAFPLLHRVRVPHDPQGFIQALCKPLASALLPSDVSTLSTSSSVFGSSISSVPSSHEQSLSRACDSVIGGSRGDRADSAVASSYDISQDIITPARSRLAAQSRILASRKTALMTVRVYDPSGDLKVNKVVGGFIGQVGSKITYDLRADRGRTLGDTFGDAEDRNQWITNTDDLVGVVDTDGEESRERSWGSCGHRLGGRIGKNVVLVDQLF
ncbi:hypothetical protein CC86DRAFT_444791 [Ophiobolus disseminans]|uniref:F-box domain-containing protein n=1 Tax=Ophiobolus disseminans TaxID=1469910 RepID=A0A6A7A644_9PLEO|nr:hypothetical protein CC86DRAFT_444791 [Ophiobolus disseminans]